MNELKKYSDHGWHVALNQFSETQDNFPHWMYDSKSAFNEMSRLPLLFKKEREGTLEKIHQQCSWSSPVELKENFLSCCLGVRCSTCPYLLALESAKAPVEDIDIMKAATCVGHILQTDETVDKSEGFILTEGDKLFWKNVYESMSSVPEEDKPTHAQPEK